jgi:hypothetical protein
MNASKPYSVTSTVARRVPAVTALLVLAAGLFIDAGTFHMMPGIGPCVSGLGVLLLPLGVGVASAAGPIEGILSIALVILAVYVAFRRRPVRIVENA